MGEEDKYPIVIAQSSVPHILTTQHRKKKDFAKVVIKSVCRLMTFGQLLQDEFGKNRKRTENKTPYHIAKGVEA